MDPNCYLSQADVTLLIGALEASQRQIEGLLEAAATRGYRPQTYVDLHDMNDEMLKRLKAMYP